MVVGLLEGIVPTASTSAKAREEASPDTASAQATTAVSTPRLPNWRYEKAVPTSGPARGRHTEMALPA